MKKKVRIIIFLLVVCIFVNKVSAVENEHAVDEWLVAYELYENAEKKYGENNYTSSLAYYRRAYEMLKEIAKESPDWNKALVQYRIIHCDKQITLIQDKLAASYQKKSFSELADENLALQNKIIDFRTLLLGEQTKLKSALKKVEENQVELSKSSRAFTDLRKTIQDKNQLEKNNMLLSVQIEELRDKSKDNEELEKLREIIVKHKSQVAKEKLSKKTIESKFNELNEKYKELSLHKTKVDLLCDQKNTELEKAKETIGSYDDKLNGLNSEIDKLNIQKEYLNKNIKQMNSRLETEKDRLAVLSKNMNTGTDSGNKALKKIQAINTSLREDLKKNQRD